MPRYLYIFGYQTPQQAQAVVAGETDENSEAFFIEADSPELALRWGREVSEAFVQGLFPTPTSWKSLNFAHGIERDADYPPAILARLPCVKVGVCPDFKQFKS